MSTKQPSTGPDRTESHAAVVNQLNHVRGLLDLLMTLTNSKDALANIESLYDSTLNHVLFGALTEIDRIREYVDNQPVSARALLLASIEEVEGYLAIPSSKGTALGLVLPSVLHDMISANERWEKHFPAERNEGGEE